MKFLGPRARNERYSSTIMEPRPLTSKKNIYCLAAFSAFLAVGFLVAVFFLGAAFLAVVFLGAAAFLAVVFLAVVFLGADAFLAVVFFLGAAFFLATVDFALTAFFGAFLAGFLASAETL
jgi:hypothetical protein